MSDVAFEIALQDQTTTLVIEAIKCKAVLEELERSFPYVATAYYYARKNQVENRLEDIKEILTRAQFKFEEKVAPEQQFLVTRRY